MKLNGKLSNKSSKNRPASISTKNLKRVQAFREDNSDGTVPVVCDGKDLWKRST